MAFVAAAPGLLRLRLDLDGRALIPSDDEAVLADARLRETFGLADSFVVFIESEHPEGILRLETLARIRQLTVEIYRYPEITRPLIMSLGSEGRDRLESLNYSPFLYPLPETAADMESLRADIEAASVLRGTLVAPDYSGAVILVRCPEGVDRGELYGKLQQTLEDVGAGDDRFHLVGTPVAEILLGRHLLQDLAKLLPFCGLLLCVTLLWLFRTPWPIILVFAEVGACLTWTFGLMGWLGHPLYLPTAVLPVILTTLGLTDEIHLLVAGQRWIRRNPGGNGRELAAAVLEEMRRPIALTSVTTAIGFLSFQASALPPVRAFGLYAGIGALFCLVWSLSVTPVLMSWMGTRRLSPEERFGKGGLRRDLFRQLPPRRMQWLVLSVCGLLTLGALRVEVQDGWMSGFAKESEFRQSVDRVNRSILGTHLLQLHILFDPLDPRAQASAEKLSREEGGDGGEMVPAFRNPGVIRAVGQVENELRAMAEVGGVLGPHSHLSTVHFLASARAEGTEKPPENAFRLRQMWRRLEVGRGPHRRKEVVTDDLNQGLITIFLKDANYRDTELVIAKARSLETSLLEPLGGRMNLAGDVAVSQAMISSIVSNQLRSVALALTGIFLFLWVILRRWRAAFWTSLPAIVASLSVLGIMGWLNIPLGVATSMFIAITLGIGVDFPVHLWFAIDRLRRLGHPNPVQAGRAVAGPAILLDTIVVSLGFGLLMISQVPASSHLGGLVAAAIVTSCAFTLFFLNSVPSTDSD